jgi:hypothetical protein
MKWPPRFAVRISHHQVFLLLFGTGFPEFHGFSNLSFLVCDRYVFSTKLFRFIFVLRHLSTITSTLFNYCIIIHT